jgi:hypothetical protein
LEWLQGLPLALSFAVLWASAADIVARGFFLPSPPVATVLLGFTHPSLRNRGSLMDAAVRCLHLVEKALKTARAAQREIARRGQNDFDLMAINCATEHLERALNELSCFADKPDDYRC